VFIAVGLNTGPIRWRQISARFVVSGEAPASNVPPQMNWTGLPKFGSDSSHRRALGRVADVVEVRQTVGRDVQDLLDVIAVVGQDLGEVGELVDLADQRLVVVVQETPDVGERLVEGAQRVVVVGGAVGQHL
jgi:hypothetical protein